MRIAICRYACLTAVLVFSGVAQAVPEDRTQTLYVDAGQCVFDVRKNESRCQHGMQVRQGTLKIDADEGTVFRQGKQIVRIELRGRPAVFQQILNPEDGLLVAKALYMDYRKAEGILVLKGQVVVKNPNLGTFSGEEMTINLNTQEIIGGQGSGDKRVHMVVEGEASAGNGHNNQNPKRNDNKKTGSATPAEQQKPAEEPAGKRADTIPQIDEKASQKTPVNDSVDGLPEKPDQPEAVDSTHD